MKKKVQASIEFVITLGFALLLIIPLTIIFFEHTQKSVEDVNTNQAGVIARKITDAASEVYYLGYPTSQTLRVYFPDYLKNVSFSGRSIIMETDQGAVIVSTANVNLTGTIRPSSGMHVIRVSALVNQVNVSDESS